MREMQDTPGSSAISVRGIARLISGFVARQKSDVARWERAGEIARRIAVRSARNDAIPKDSSAVLQSTTSGLIRAAVLDLAVVITLFIF